jgi:hypothetical protein
LALERSMLLKKLLMKHWSLLMKRLKTRLKMLRSWPRSMLLRQPHSLLLMPLLMPLLRLLGSLRSLLFAVLFD